MITVKPKTATINRTKIGFQDYYRFMQVKSIAEGEHSAIILTFIKIVPDSPAYVQKCFIF